MLTQASDSPPLEMDGVQLRAVKRRFLAINNDRLKRVQISVRERQKDFLDLLPLLFHINHPMLPGYISSKTPAGICDYTPSERSIEAGKRLSKSFTYSRRAVRQYNIHALYLMGSSGTIAYSPNSDFDIWVCVRPDLDEAGLQALARKAEGIETWAATIGLEVHFFLMNDEAFRAGEVSSLSQESSGTAQHHLLLDEFYRTGLLIAGRYPIWWLVPPEYETCYEEYVHELKRRRFVGPHDTVDFGGIGRMPAGEFFGAALWQLYKGVSSPYKSVLKILLMEAYAGEYPQVQTLGLRYKQRVYGGDSNLDEMDPYIQLVTRVEEYLLENGELERLELARRCFYFKIHERMSRPDRRGTISWRREVMRELVQDWGWSQAHLLMLDARQSWKIQRVLEERQSLIDALSQSYRALSDFARQHARQHAIDPAELNLLGRRLYVAFERKAGKVDIINPGISDDLLEERLSLHQVRNQGQEGWVLYRGDVPPAETRGQRPLKRTPNLLEILAWCHFNRIVHPHGSMIRLQPEDCSLSTWELRSVMECLEDIFPNGSLAEPEMAELAEPARVRENALFINLGIDPLAKLTRNGMQLVSNRTDALSYGGRWENLALDFEMILVTSWQEVLTFRYSGRDALLDCLCDYLAWSPLSSASPPMAVSAFSFSSTRGAAIAHRVEEVFRNVIDWFYHNEWRDTARYVLPVGHEYYVLQSENEVPRYTRLSSHKALLAHLGAAQDSFSPVRIDGSTLGDTPLALIYETNRPGVIQLFYQVQGNRATVYVLDEMGALFHQQAAFHDALTLLTQYQRFLEKIRQRRSHLAREQHQETSIGDIEYYQILQRAGSQPRLERQNISPFRQSQSYFGVQVIGDVLDDQRTHFTMYCNEMEFSSLEHGDALFEEVARYVLQQRSSGQAYPIYITDIDLAQNLLGGEAAQGLQTVHFLNYKKRIEQRLNEALNRL
ncbi:class I adenylate cyclase [Thiohalobacter sp. IOR34]|uniref:class I adenylate cyclase n=1 Tax=Thiohalobacter sp. IOR34 TaxID=3057176 RepID=UPI0025B176D8|nr:class I adenylate cyclase [Thiohalobacter sp. IOR34]WJW75585.1 class I adenylate cyclase [Thiohalobacter sp. IOR34]